MLAVPSPGGLVSAILCTPVLSGLSGIHVGVKNDVRKSFDNWQRSLTKEMDLERLLLQNGGMYSEQQKSINTLVFEIGITEQNILQ